MLLLELIHVWNGMRMAYKTVQNDRILCLCREGKPFEDFCVCPGEVRNPTQLNWTSSANGLSIVKTSSSSGETVFMLVLGLCNLSGPTYLLSSMNLQNSTQTNSAYT